MRDFKKRAIIIGTIIFLMMAFATWYKVTYSMSIAKAFEVNNQYQNKNLLIATQGSEFKDKLVSKVIETYRNDSIFLKVIDINELSSIDPKNYSALLIIHTWEYSKPPPAVRLFIDRTTKYQHKIVVCTTSGAGSCSMDDVDAISGESKMVDIPLITNQIVTKLNPLINNNHDKDTN